MDLSTPTLPTPVVSADWLAKHLGDPNVAIADCRFSLSEPNQGQQHYRQQHIPGAIYFDLNRDLSSPVQSHGGRHPLPDVQTFVERLSANGIGSGGTGRSPTQVVVYDDSRFAFAARFWWLLRYLGHDAVAILDGGFSAWVQGKYPVSQVTPNPKLATFVPKIRSDWLRDRTQVKLAQADMKSVLVDARDGDRFRGEREPIDPISGHIPGAISYPWRDITDENGFVKPVSYHQQRWQTVQDREQVIVYCGSGVTACVDLMSLELAGLSTGRLYAGSWSDWCSYDDADVELG